MTDRKRDPQPPTDAQRSSASDALWSGVGFPGDVTVGGIGTRVLVVRRTPSEASEPGRDDRAGESGRSRRSVGR